MTSRIHTLLIAAAVLGLLAVAAAGFAAPSARAADDYPWPNAAMGLNSMSPLGFNLRNCTDFVAFRLNQQMGGAVSPASAQRFNWSILTHHNGGRGGAVDWKQDVIATPEWGPSRVNSTPAVGSVAWFASGHVAIVTAVYGDGSVQIEEYARAMILQEEQHLGEVDKMLRRPGDIGKAG